MTFENSPQEKNPYLAPTTEQDLKASSRTPSTLAWVLIILGALIGSGVVFFFTCFGVFMVGIQVDSATAGPSVINQWLPLAMLSIPFIAFFATFYFIILAFRRSYAPLEHHPTESETTQYESTQQDEL